MQGSDHHTAGVAPRVAIVNVLSEALTHRRVGNLNRNALIRGW